MVVPTLSKWWISSAQQRRFDAPRLTICARASASGVLSESCKSLLAVARVSLASECRVWLGSRTFRRRMAASGARPRGCTGVGQIPAPLHDSFGPINSFEL